jgi:hypothetical protein
MEGPQTHVVHWERSSDPVCSFCGKKKQIAGSGGVCICDECIDLCNEIIVEDAPNWWPWHAH